MRTLTVAGFALLLCACQQWPSYHIDQLPGFPLLSIGERSNSPHQIAVGDRWPEARERIVASGGKDITRYIDQIAYGYVTYWYELKDGTSLCVSLPSPEEDVIQGLELGVRGHRHDKLEWIEKSHHVEFVELDNP